jgi:hypothetical protein
MATSVPAIVWSVNFALQSGNPLTQGTASAAPLDSAQLIQGDQRLLQIYFLLAAVQQGAVATNVQLPAGATLTVAGKLANALGATSLLFETGGFVLLQDANSLYFAQAFLDLDTQEISDAFAAAGAGQNTLACLVDVIVNVPAQAAANPVPAIPPSRATFQIAVTLKQQVYSGDESNPVPATPAYPEPGAVDAGLAQAAAALPVSSLTGLSGGGGTNLDGMAVATAPAVLPTYYTMLIVLFTGAVVARLELNSDPVNGAQVIVPPDDVTRSWRIRL